MFTTAVINGEAAPGHSSGEAMTVSGSKVEVTDDLSKTMHGVKVGRIVSIEKHPNSDHMWICQVDVGQPEPVQIVTGAQNVHEGDLVPTALHNSWLPGGVHITKGKLRGEVSCGMLCSFAELGLTQNDLPGVFADGKSGIITATITWSIISLKSCIAPFRRLPLITAIPNPKVNANTKAVITSINGGMAIVKYGFNATACPKEVIRSAAVIIHG